jgi:hypothetical protein
MEAKMRSLEKYALNRLLRASYDSSIDISW